MRDYVRRQYRWNVAWQLLARRPFRVFFVDFERWFAAGEAGRYHYS
jgi:hypothetical protein